MTVQADHWLTTQVAPPPHDWIAIFANDDGLEVRDVVAVLVQSSEGIAGTSARVALAVATFDGLLIPARDQNDFAGAMARADYDEAKAAAKGLAS
jgi:hypothetical protein